MTILSSGIARLTTAAVIICFLSCKKNDQQDAGTITAALGPANYYIQKASYINYAEMTLGEITLNSKGNDWRVRAFAGAMAFDHSNMQKALRDSASPALTPVTTDSAHIRTINDLQGLSGYSFDTAYLKMEIREHDSAIRLYQEPINFVPVGPRLRGYFVEFMPRLLLHRKIADSLLHEIQ